ncbi:SCP-like protein [Dictyocaulus viviparus]|uniref:SCP-like protein n=1 Tax=Dictyocaulus viviparus TaxID=29172 RepID=A0A0D8XWA2_DICVI|nr:SCP-like protein [Dictyocaulus viviparus]
MPFDCGDVYLSDQARQDALDQMNKIRSEVALGQFHAWNLLPTANNMMKLKWDCNLEQMAHNATEYCSRYHPQASLTYGINYHRGDVFDSSELNLSSSILSSIKKWSNIPNIMWPNRNIFNGNLELADFANLVFANTTAVGCSNTKCSSRTSVACVFSGPEILTGTLVYNSGNPCLNDTKCGTSGYCELGLCIDEGEPEPAPTPAPVQPLSPVIINCPTVEFDSTFRTTALGMHNNFRSLVARGLARNGDQPNENAPPSSQMDLLVYDCNAEQIAFNHVKSCVKQPSPLPSGSEYSENIHNLQTTPTDILGVLQNAISTWTQELEANGIPSNMIFINELDKRLKKVVTNVTKIIWGSSRTVGCATQLCNGFYLTSCLYRKPVNVIGQNIYNIGAVCSTCPAGVNNCDGNVGLCSW